MRFLRHPALHWILGIAVGAVFLYACADKIQKPVEFARIVYHYQLLGPSQRLGYLPANLLAVVLPWVEAVTGVLLVVNVWRREAATTAALMLVMFLVAVAWGLAHGINLENCGCFKVTGTGRGFGIKLVLGDAALLLASLVLALAPPAARVSAPSSAPAATPVAAL